MFALSLTRAWDGRRVVLLAPLILQSCRSDCGTAGKSTLNEQHVQPLKEVNHESIAHMCRTGP